MLVLGLAACATGETPNLGDASDPSMLGGSSGSGSEAGSSADAGTFNQGGSTAAGTGGTGGTAPTAGAFVTGGQVGTAGTFGTAGTVSGGTGGGGASGGGAGGGGAGGGGAGGTGGTGGKAGSGGTGGTPPNATCAQNPITAKTTWVATAVPEVTSQCANDPNSAYCGPAERAVDSMPSTRFSTGRARMGDEYITVDFGEPVTVTRVVLNTAAGSGDYTLGYEIRMANSANDAATAAVIVMGAGMQGTTTINFPSPQTGQFLRIDQTETMDGWWSLTEIDVSCQ